MKRFLALPIIYQWLITFVYCVLFVMITYWWVMLVSETKLLMLLIFFIVPVIQFLLTPLLTLLGVYTYYSPMVVTMGGSTRILDLHNGTSFDYLFEMRGTKPGAMWKKKMLHFYLSALSNIIRKIEAGDLSEAVTVRGSSYFLSERSAHKMGFSQRGTSLPEKLNIFLNYVDLIWMYSLSNGRLVFPNLANISTVSISGKELLAKKAYITNLLQKLSPSAEK